METKRINSHKRRTKPKCFWITATFLLLIGVIMSPCAYAATTVDGFTVDTTPLAKYLSVTYVSTATTESVGISSSASCAWSNNTLVATGTTGLSTKNIPLSAAVEQTISWTQNGVLSFKYSFTADSGTGSIKGPGIDKTISSDVSEISVSTSESVGTLKAAFTNSTASGSWYYKPVTHSSTLTLSNIEFIPYFKVVLPAVEGGSYTYQVNSGNATAVSSATTLSNPGAKVTATTTDSSAATTYTLTATVADGYNFYGWQTSPDGGNTWSTSYVSTDTTYTFTPDADVTIRPHFVEVSVDTTFVPQTGGSFNVDGVAITQSTKISESDSHEYTLVADAADGYFLTGLYVGSKASSAAGAYTYIAPTQGEHTFTITGIDAAGEVYPIFTKEQTVIAIKPDAGVDAMNITAKYGEYTIPSTTSGSTTTFVVPEGTVFSGTPTMSSGYQFSSWIKKDKDAEEYDTTVSMSAALNNTFNDGDIFTLLSIKQELVFHVSNADNQFYTWESAMQYAKSLNSTVNVYLMTAQGTSFSLPVTLADNGFIENQTYTQMVDGVLTYTVPSNIRFIVRHDSDSSYPAPTVSGQVAYAVMAETTGVGGNGRVAVGTSVYRELVVPQNTTIDMENGAAFLVGGTLNGVNDIVGTHSNVKLESGAKIQVNSGSVLSTCGYIYGDGEIIVKTGGKVYQPFTIHDFHAGGWTVSAGYKASDYKDSPLLSGTFMTDADNEAAVTPFVRYGLYAIQCKLTIEHGGELCAYVNMHAQSKHNREVACMISDSAEAALLALSSGASVEITYDEDMGVGSYTKYGRTTMDVSGGATYGVFSLTVPVLDELKATITSNLLRFPLPYNFEINLKDGEYYIPNDLNVLPGATIYVGDDAVLHVNGKLTVFDGLKDYTAEASGGSHVWQSAFATSEYGYVDTAVKMGVADAYPSTEQLTAKGLSGSGQLIVDGTLALESGAFGGIIQTNGVNGAKITTSTALLDATRTAGNGVTGTKTQVGGVGKVEVNLILKTNTYYTAGATVYTLNGRIVDTLTGNITEIIPGETYYADPNSPGAITSYSEDVYYYSADLSKKTTVTVDGLDLALAGSWYTDELPVCVKYGGTEYDTDMTAKVAINASLADSDYYTVAYTEQGTVTADTAKLYVEPVAVIFDKSNTPVGAYASLSAAIAAYPGDTDGHYIQIDSSVETLTENVTLTKDTILDLNGCDITGTITLDGHKLFGADTATSDYDAQDKGSVVVSGTAEKKTKFNTRNYIAVQNGNTWSFYRASVAVTGAQFIMGGDDNIYVIFEGGIRGNDAAVTGTVDAGFSVGTTESWHNQSVTGDSPKITAQDILAGFDSTTGCFYFYYGRTESELTGDIKALAKLNGAAIEGSAIELETLESLLDEFPDELALAKEEVQ